MSDEPVLHPILWLADAIRHRRAAALATVVEVVGASPAKPGAEILLREDGSTAGTAGGGRLEAAILSDARAALTDGRPRLAHYRLSEEGPDAIGVLCGGEVRVFIRPYLPPPKLVIVGGGHVGRPLKAMAEAADFEVAVVDVEPGRASVPGLDSVALTRDTFIVLLTTDHVTDEAALRQVIHSPVPYIGMIGSRAKCRTILGHLAADSLDAEALARVHAPVGLDLGGTTPGEIAAAILAQIIGVRHGRVGPVWQGEQDQLPQSRAGAEEQDAPGEA